MRDTLIFVPTYNERHNVERMVRDLLALPIDADLLFVDDSSPDGTGQILDELASANPRLTVLHRQGKLGIGSAHLDGIAWAYDHGFERLVTLDCDFTHDPADVLRLIANADGHDVTVGSRYLMPGSLPGWNPVRRSLTGLGHVLTFYLLRIPFDATGALRLYDLRKIPREVFGRIRNRGYGFFFESMFVLVRDGRSVKELPIRLPARTYGNSKMTLKETLKSGSQLLSLWGRSTLNPGAYRSSKTQADESQKDQGWDSYWGKKAASSGKLYDFIATAYRQQVIRRGLERAITREFKPGARLLHAGCGSGQVDERLHDRVRITAIDISPAALRLYRSSNKAGSTVAQADIFALPFPGATFDGVYNLGVMEHFELDEIERIFTELRRVMKPDGKLVLFWPHARATSVAVLRGAHWVLNDVLKRPAKLHPAEVSLLKGRTWVEGLLRRSGFALRDYWFGWRDFFVQAVIVAEREQRPSRDA